MMSLISGFFLGIFKNMAWIGYAMVESLIFMWVFNFLAPVFLTWGWDFLPADHISYKISLAAFLMIGFIGGWIKSLSPFSLSVTSKSKSE